MQRVSEEKINEVRNSADIVSIISDYIPLKMQGRNYFGVCPFHDDHTPSMSVSKDRQIFKCFVCNKGGNVFTFVSEYENISFLEAVKKVADKVGIPLDFEINKKEDNKYKLEYEIMDYATKIFQNNLNSKEGVKAKEYLEKRSITESIIKDFHIGLAINDNTYLYNVLNKKNYNINTLEELGLINKDGLTGYDKFVNRIMIPICNLDGKVVGFTGRIFNGEDTAKYINTKETIIYKKGNMIFNFHNAKSYIRDEKCAILVEGNMDAIRVYSSGIKNVLALMGTAMTKEQVEILKKLHVPIILMLDNDDAGHLATLNIGDVLTNNNIDVKVVRLSGAKDPDEYIVKFGIDKFRETIKYSINYFDYKLNSLKENKNLNNADDLVNFVKSVIKMLEGKDNLTKEITLKKISEEYKIDYEVLKNEVEFEKEKPIISNYHVNQNKKNTYSICVNNILYYMMSDSKYINIFNDKLGFLKNSEERDLVREIEYFNEKYDKINLADFVSYAESNDNIKKLVNNIINDVNDDLLNEKTFNEYINRINLILSKEERAKLVNSIKSEEDINKKVEISNRLRNIVKGSVK